MLQLENDAPVQFAQGWYRVPGSEQERYWDGDHWTGAFRPTTALASAHVASNPGPAIASMVLRIISLVIPHLGIISALVGSILGEWGLT
jgi:hypothetical protein